MEESKIGKMESEIRSAISSLDAVVGNIATEIEHLQDQIGQVLMKNSDAPEPAGTVAVTREVTSPLALELFEYKIRLTNVHRQLVNMSNRIAL